MLFNTEVWDMPILGDQGADSGDKGKFQTDGKKWQKEKKKRGEEPLGITS